MKEVEAGVIGGFGALQEREGALEDEAGFGGGGLGGSSGGGGAVPSWGIGGEHLQFESRCSKFLSKCSSLFICFCQQQLLLAEINHVICFSQSKVKHMKIKLHFEIFSLIAKLKYYHFSKIFLRR